MDDSQELRLLKMPVQLSAPKSYSALFDLVGQDPSLRLFGACIGVCWPRADKLLKVSLAQHKYDVLGYGGAVVDGLVAQRVPVADIMRVGEAAYRLCVESLAGMTEPEVAAAEGFSKEQEP